MGIRAERSSIPLALLFTKRSTACDWQIDQRSFAELRSLTWKRESVLVEFAGEMKLSFFLRVTSASYFLESLPIVL